MPASDTRPCILCSGLDDEGLILLCDECNLPYHAHCVDFEGGLEGDWLCPECADGLCPESEGR